MWPFRCLPLLFMACLASAELFGGSERLKDIEDSFQEFQELVEDKGHIQEELSSLFTADDIKKMAIQEIAFNWFYAHDTDEDGKLDGLEVLKAVLTHSHGEGGDDGAGEDAPAPVSAPGYAGEAGATAPGPITPISDEAMDAATGLVDELLARYDLDNDGLLNYVEFMTSFEENHERLTAKKKTTR